MENDNIEMNSTIYDASKTEEEKFVATSVDMLLAYGSLVIMAVIPIYFGALRSIKSHSEAVQNIEISGEKPETMTTKDAAMFPFIASCALFGLYIFFQTFSKDKINALLSFYFLALGSLALAKVIAPIFKIPTRWIPRTNFHLSFTRSPDDATETDAEDLIDFKFSSHDIIYLIASSTIGVWYFLKKHWLANNLLGLSFALNGIELLHLNRIITGIILLCGLFVYDIFWVFGTDVMLTVAKNFDAPIKLVFPQDLILAGFSAKHYAMLGLGDIVIPGIFIALLLRFDIHLTRPNGARIYFKTGMFAYLGGLLFTIIIMHIYKHAQPALLYLVPSCIGLPLLVALIKGDLKLMFSYEDHPEKKEEDDKKNE